MRKETSRHTINLRCNMCGIGIGTSMIYDSRTRQIKEHKHIDKKPTILTMPETLCWVWRDYTGIKVVVTRKSLFKGRTYKFCKDCYNSILKRLKEI